MKFVKVPVNKYCNKCKRASLFYSMGKHMVCKKCVINRNKEYYKKNKVKILEKGKEWRNNNADYIRNRDLLKNYNISLADFGDIYVKQGKKCAICMKELKTYAEAFTDHDHKTGNIRGILCIKCNSGIGMFDDNIDILKNAIKYIESYY